MTGGRLLLALRWGRVVSVRRGEARGGGASAQWLVTLEDADGALVRDIRVVGSRAPIVGATDRPSWALWGCIAGNLNDSWCLPCPAVSAPAGAHSGHEGLDEYSAVAVTVAVDGTWSILGRPDGDPRVVVTPDRGWQDQPTVELLGGVARMAREDDFVAINAATSPAFASWMQAVQAALQTLAAAAGSDIVPPVVAPVLPADTVPAVEDTAAQAASPQIVGRVATASPWTRGR